MNLQVKGIYRLDGSKIMFIMSKLWIFLNRVLTSCQSSGEKLSDLILAINVFYYSKILIIWINLIKEFTD